eukprot:gnl/Dysnectes_brevis/6372_a9835_452.p1 GENE.gnl/Dysnectes_brevis/6372_a9835_452~~gnl/Dysnectes_brevis/6372_a9835_452.p1  ORF type:complete len:186 (-),score=26.18 gnl/Dysnectes_brevis/6372_a9835_452:140-697(-)
MGSHPSKSSLFRLRAKILLLGLDCTGKTSFLHKIAPNSHDIESVIPTIGFCLEVLTHKHLSITSWDEGGATPLRPLYQHYYQDCTAVIFMVDAADRDRFREEQERDCFRRIYGESRLRGLPFLILANKADRVGARSVSEIADNLRIADWDNAMRCHIQETSVIFNSGVAEGLDWLIDELTDQAEL